MVVPPPLCVSTVNDVVQNIMIEVTTLTTRLTRLFPLNRLSRTLVILQLVLEHAVPVTLALLSIGSRNSGRNATVKLPMKELTIVLCMLFRLPLTILAVLLATKRVITFGTTTAELVRVTTFTLIILLMKSETKLTSIVPGVKAKTTGMLRVGPEPPMSPLETFPNVGMTLLSIMCILVRTINMLVENAVVRRTENMTKPRLLSSLDLTQESFVNSVMIIQTTVTDRVTTMAAL